MLKKYALIKIHLHIIAHISYRIGYTEVNIVEFDQAFHILHDEIAHVGTRGVGLGVNVLIGGDQEQQ